VRKKSGDPRKRSKRQSSGVSKTLERGRAGTASKKKKKKEDAQMGAAEGASQLAARFAGENLTMLQLVDTAGERERNSQKCKTLLKCVAVGSAKANSEGSP